MMVLVVDLVEVLVELIAESRKSPGSEPFGIDLFCLLPVLAIGLRVPREVEDKVCLSDVEETFDEAAIARDKLETGVRGS